MALLGNRKGALYRQRSRYHHQTVRPVNLYLIRGGMDKNEWLVQSPRIFQESFTDLQHCCRICSALGCDSDLVRKFDQCAADQNQLAKQSSILAREVAYRWVPSCIKWYEQMRLKANVDEDVKMKLATQAEELSRAFFEISRRARACGGSLHDAQVTAQQKADYYYKKSREAAVEAERYERRMNEARKEAEEEMKTAREKSNTAENLRIAAWATILLPPVALGLATGASIVSSQSESAEERADAAGRASERARSSKWDAEFRQTKFQVTNVVQC